MHAAPRAASASLSKSVSPGRGTWGKRQRLLRPPEFAAFLPPQAPWRAARRWLAMSVTTPLASSPTAATAVGSGRVRFGLTVSRRQARRAVARNTVRRVLREAARTRAPLLEAALAVEALDILFRLKAPLPEPAAAGWSAVKAQLRREAESLLEQLLGVLRSCDSAGAAALFARQSLAQSTRRPGSVASAVRPAVSTAASTAAGIAVSRDVSLDVSPDVSPAPSNDASIAASATVVSASSTETIASASAVVNVAGPGTRPAGVRE